MGKIVRIPLAWPIGTRSGTSTDKDPYIFNGIVERYGDKNYVVKRPGSEEYLTLGDGDLNQGITYWQDMFWGVVDDVLYRDPATTPLVGTEGETWTSPGTPQWSATEDQGAVVFNNRMWMISGVSENSGIWSSVDGVNWVANVGAPPWGFRLRPGVCVLNGVMYVMGGYDPNTGTLYNDVWSSSDGTNWTLISADGLPDKWAGRAGFCCVAATNGIYVYSGWDAVTTYYDDVWFSVDGITWNLLTDTPGWAARWGAAFYWFDNKIWIAAGYDGSTYYEDCWYSPDGITWTQATAQMFVGGVYFPYFAVYRDLLWIIGGFGSGGATAFVANSPDGVTWTIQTAPNFSGRGNGQMLVFGVPASVNEARYQTMYLIGGGNGVVSLQEVLYGDIDLAMPASFPLTPVVDDQQYQFNTYINGQLLLLKNQSNFWFIQSGTLVEVTDENYPITTVPGLVVLNAFAYVMTPQGEIHNCKIENPAIWPSLDFVTADYEDDEGVALAKYLNYVVAFGQYTTQFFYDNGANQTEGSPLAPYINANLRVGCAQAESVATISNTLFWVAQTRQGARYVAMFNGLSDQKISTPYIDKIIAATPTDFLVGFGMAVGGHFYYVLKTTDSKALVYDISQQEWYEWDTFSYRQFVSDGTASGNYLWAINGGVLVQTSPLLYSDAYSDATYNFFCVTDKIDFDNTALKFYGRAVLVGDTSDATPTIEWTDDDYQTYVSGGTVDMQSERPYITRLGAARRRAWRPSQEDDNPARWQALEITYDQGES